MHPVWHRAKELNRAIDELGDSLCLVFFLGGTGSNVVTGVWLELLLLW